jgi:hypothetical protein
VQLRVTPPLKPRLARPVKEAPEAVSVEGGLIFEPDFVVGEMTARVDLPAPLVNAGSDRPPCALPR